MSKVHMVGLITVVGIGIALFGMTLGLSWISYKKWKQVPVQPINEPVVRSWKDTMV